MYSIQEKHAALATARILSGSSLVEIRSHNFMGVAYSIPMVYALVKPGCATSGYSGRYWVQIGTIGELAAP